MRGKHRTGVDATRRNECAGEETEAYLYAIKVLKNALSGLETMGVAPNEQCDALGYTLINLLLDHYPKAPALLLFETLRSTLEECYESETPSLCPEHDDPFRLLSPIAGTDEN